MSLITTHPDQFLELLCKAQAALSDEPDHRPSPRSSTMLQGWRSPSCAQLAGGVALALWGANSVSVVGLVGWLLITSSKTKGCKGFHGPNSVLMWKLWGCFQPVILPTPGSFKRRSGEGEVCVLPWGKVRCLDATKLWFSTDSLANYEFS